MNVDRTLDFLLYAFTYILPSILILLFGINLGINAFVIKNAVESTLSDYTMITIPIYILSVFLVYLSLLLAAFGYMKIYDNG